MYFYLLNLLISSLPLILDTNNIIINKKNVDYVFVPFDVPTDNFVINQFSGWEKKHLMSLIKLKILMA